MLLDLLMNARGDARWDITLAFLEDGPMAAAAREMGYEVRVIPAGRLRQPLAFARAVRLLADWIRETRPSAVLSWMPKAHFYGGPAARMAGVPAVWFQHGITGGNWLDRLTSWIPAAGVSVAPRPPSRRNGGCGRQRPTQVVISIRGPRPILRGGAALSSGLSGDPRVTPVRPGRGHGGPSGAMEGRPRVRRGRPRSARRIPMPNSS